MASGDMEAAATVRELVLRLSLQPQAQRPDVDKHGHARASSLETVDLPNLVHIRTDEANLVEALEGLQHLDLARSSIGDQGMIVLMKAFKEGSGRGSSLRYLGLMDNGITKRGFSALTEALGNRFLPNLEHLIIAGNRLGEEGVDMLAMVLRNGRLSSLKGIDLSSCEMRDMGMVSLADALQSGVFHAVGLQSLDFSANGIGEHGASSLARALSMRRLPALRFLNLSANELGVRGTEAVSMVLKSGMLSGLTNLLLSCCSLSNAVVPVAEALHILPNLQVLDLSGNYVGDQGSRALSLAFRTGRMSGLQSLSLSQCDIGPREAQLIFKAIEVGRILGLRYLDLSYNPLDAKPILSGHNTERPHSGRNGSDYNLSDKGSMTLVNLVETRCLSWLEHLDLSYTCIRDLELTALMASMTAGKLPRLWRFLFNGNEIRWKRTIKAFVRAMESGHLSYLQELELGVNSVGEDANLALASALMFSRSARGPLVEKLKQTLIMKTSAAPKRTARDRFKSIIRNRSFTALEPLTVGAGNLPPEEKIYNKYLERQYSNHQSPLVNEENDELQISDQARQKPSTFILNLFFVCIWLLGVIVSRKF